MNQIVKACCKSRIIEKGKLSARIGHKAKGPRSLRRIRGSQLPIIGKHKSAYSTG